MSESFCFGFLGRLLVRAVVGDAFEFLAIVCLGKIVVQHGYSLPGTGLIFVLVVRLVCQVGDALGTQEPSQ